jgi:periplasmic protein CpxP/Spy
MRIENRFASVWKLVAVAVIIGGIGAGVYAQQQPPPSGPVGGWQGPGMRGRGPMGRVGIALGQLNLTDEQKQQVKSIFEGHKADFQALADRARPARQAMADAIASGDEAAVRQRSTEMGAVQTERAVLAAKVRNEVFKILTPEQQQKAQALRQQFQQRMEHRRGPRKDRFPE